MQRNIEPVAIMGCLEGEMHLINRAISQPSITRQGAYRFISGSIKGIPVVSVMCVGSMSHAATATALAIERFHPSCVIMQGTAGGHDPGLASGTIVIGSSVVNAGAYISPLAEAGKGTDPLQWVRGRTAEIDVAFDATLSEACDENLVALAQSTPYRQGKTVVGAIATSDSWNREADFILHLHTTLHTLCEEMEGFAVATACKAFGVPMVDIRIISNNHLLNEDFSLQAADQCQEFVLSMVSRMRA